MTWSITWILSVQSPCKMLPTRVIGGSTAVANIVEGIISMQSGYRKSILRPKWLYLNYHLGSYLTIYLVHCISVSHPSLNSYNLQFLVSFTLPAYNPSDWPLCQIYLHLSMVILIYSNMAVQVCDKIVIDLSDWQGA